MVNDGIGRTKNRPVLSPWGWEDGTYRNLIQDLEFLLRIVPSSAVEGLFGAACVGATFGRHFGRQRQNQEQFLSGKGA
jgi:hypothetical protein